MDEAGNDKNIVWEGRYVDLVMRGRWEYAARKNLTGIVAMVPVTDDGKVVLVEQFRPPVDAQVLELPAGLVGDLADHAAETFETAAERELVEETGYRADRFEFLFEGPSSPGVTDEVVTVLKATGLTKVSSGGGDKSENITVHEVAINGLTEWLEEQKAQGKLVDMKIYSVLYYCRRDSGVA